MRRRSHPEDAIQRAITAHYQARATPGTFMFAVPNGGWRSPVTGAILKATGTVAGVPDTIWVKGGQVWAVEIKTPDGKPSKVQTEIIAAMEAAGAHCFIAYGLDAAIEFLEAQGLLRGKSATPRN